MTTSAPHPTPLWQAGNRVSWQLDAYGLPFCTLHDTAPWPYPPQDPHPRVESDPYSIIGNYGLTCFPHASGSFQLLHTERGFARLNHDGGDAATGRACRSRISVNGVAHNLLGNAETFHFGCGQARWEYRIGPLHVTRRLQTLPSRDHRDRIPAMVLTTTIRNGGDADVAFTYEEGVAARYHVANWCNPPSGRQQARYPVQASVDGRHASASFHAQATTPLVLDHSGWWAQADAHPASLQLSVLSGASIATPESIDDESSWLRAICEQTLEPGATTTCRLAIGWADDELPWTHTLARIDVSTDTIAQAWAERLPVFSEAPADLAAELRWHAHVLHAMATWDTRYRCAFIPQGTLYEYGVGVAAVTRDHAMHALPACSYDPDLARSVVSYLCRHTDPTGRIQHTDEGMGLFPLGCDQKSDNQLYALLLMAEYLERQGTDLLGEQEPFFPCGCDATGTVLDRIARWIRYLRDVIHVGAHGLIRICYSDISDTLHGAFREQGYTKTFNGESHVNTTMAITVLDRIADVLATANIQTDQRDLRDDIVTAARDIVGNLRAALEPDLQAYPWCPRGRVGDQVLGGEDAFSMPQAFLLADDKRDRAQRQRIWEAIKPRVWDDEPFGVRLRDGAGKHRCGMVWSAWSGNVASGLMHIDPDAARATLERMRLRTRAEREPQQWIGLWSNSDVTAAYQGAGDWQPGTTRSGYVGPFPIFCAHVHAWPLQLWQEWERLQSG